MLKTVNCVLEHKYKTETSKHDVEFLNHKC